MVKQRERGGQSIWALAALMHSWRDEGMELLLMTHNVELAAEAVDRIILLEEEQVSASGSPPEVLVTS